MKKYLVVAALAALPMLALAQQQEPTFPAPAVGASTAALRQMFLDYWEWRLSQDPVLATQMGRHEYNDRWADWSRAARQRARARREEFLQQVIYIGQGNLTRADRLSADLLEYELKTALDAEPYTLLVGRLTQQGGAHTQVLNAIDQMPTATVGDYENILARIRALPAYVDQHMELYREQLDAGLAQPALVVDLVAGQVAAQSSGPAAESPLLAPFRRMPASIPPGDQQRLLAAASAAYTGDFVPSWKKLEAFLRDTYRPRARREIAVTSLAGGDKAYATLVRTFTTTRMTAKEIHELGLREVERLDREMQAVAKEAGFTGPATEFEQQLRARPDLRFASQDDMLTYARDVLARLQPAIPRLFKRVPKAAVGVRPIPPDQEAATASNYTAGSPDGTRQAWFNMNTYRPQDQSRYTVEALVVHESVPGHHLQVGLARELEGVPDFRRVFGTTAFTEGWALYAESLGTELGIYRDPASRAGQLASEKFRAVRLVVDTGIHAFGWSRERALDYFKLHAPAQSLAEIDRYIAWPGQALAYKVGQLEIRELRERAEKALGPRFDIREFHDVVLRNGALPLDMLEEQVDFYIAGSRSR